jgi:NAD(P)-dependent dehydrogenase (short-subunit alcohol dehydrogenase family)
MSEALQGKTAVVTGAASGLGRAICHELSRAGCRIIGTDVNAQGLQQVMEEIGGAQQGEHTPVVFDLRSAIDIVRAWERFDALGTVDILVNNAGVDHTLPVPELSVEQIDQVLDANLRGPFLMAREAVTRWRERKRGDIVNIASTAAKRTWPNASAYHASKWGLLGLSHALHSELREDGIRVTAVVVGGMRTPFILERFPEVDPEVLQDPANPARVVRSVLELPADSVVPEVMVLPMRETSWP